MILETEIAFDDDQAEKYGREPELIWRAGVIDLKDVEAFCVADFKGEGLPDVTNIYTKNGNVFTVKVPYDAMYLIMQRLGSERPRTWEQIVKLAGR